MVTTRATWASAFLLSFLLSGVAAACILHGNSKPVWRDDSATLHSGKIATPLWVGPAFSGSWYTSARSGEGFVVQVLDNGSVVAVWFTYPPQGSTAKQAWIFAQDGVIEGNRVRFGTVFTTRGPRFGAGYDPAQLQVQPWGTLEFQFTDCNTGSFTYAGPAAWGSGTRAFERLSAIDEIECGARDKLTANGARALSGLRQRSGAWFDPTHNGEGWMVEELPDGRVLIYWFTYDAQGEQAWTIGSAPQAGADVEVGANLRPQGTFFGADFNASAITLQPWGNYRIAYSDCQRGVLNYESTLSEFGAGMLRPQRLATLASSVCVDGTPDVQTNGTWSAGTPMPQPQSEHAVAAHGGKFYAVGGFGDPRGLKRYDPANNSWQDMADLPAGRDHLLAASIGGEIIVTGGNQQSGDTNPGFHYNVAQNAWQSVSTVPGPAASGAAALNGYVYLGSESGDVFQYDPRRRVARVLPSNTGVPRDHSQLVAFGGEIWFMGGRGQGVGETAAVAIFDPASETWRVGPSMRVARGGFAAASDGTRLFVAGGEVIFSGAVLSLVNRADAIALGQNQWSILPNLPVAIHGMGGTVLDHAFYVLGGSTQAGGIRNAGEVQIYRWNP